MNARRGVTLKLSPHLEKQVVKACKAGYSDRDIAAMIGVAYNTIRKVRLASKLPPRKEGNRVCNRDHIKLWGILYS